MSQGAVMRMCGLPQILIKIAGMQALDRGMVLPTRYTFNADGTAIYLTGDVDARNTESALPSVRDATPVPVQPPPGRH
ncbi:hypothetical protein [Paraburkholderia sediminicola]|uniref:hypothetical protein n=1 Tax=Paraburkholderia sediminicola TaxID=458836 RepID=UPI0038B7362F